MARLDPEYLRHIVAAALSEDVGQGDITSQLTIPSEKEAEMNIIAREEMVVCGMAVPGAVFGQLDAAVAIHAFKKDGDRVKADTILLSIKGNARTLLTGERTLLNLMQHMSGISTLTSRYVDAVKGTKVGILDTRKTTPGLRMLDKYAVSVGGGENHRLRLDDMVLIKDNHITVCGSIGNAIEKARNGTSLPVIVECDTPEQVKQALLLRPDRILLDNMNTKTLREVVAFVAGAVTLEASGGVSLETVRAIAETGVDYISVGKLTHSAPAADISADIKVLT